MHLGFMDVILLQWSATSFDHFSPNSRWPHECPKHVGDHYAIKLHPWNQRSFAGCLKYFMHLINAQNMEHMNLITVFITAGHLSLSSARPIQSTTPTIQLLEDPF
jgi:hypothetical protein